MSLNNSSSSADDRVGAQAIRDFLAGNPPVGFGVQEVPGFPDGLRVSLCSPPFGAVKISASPQTLYSLFKNETNLAVGVRNPLLAAVGS